MTCLSYFWSCQTQIDSPISGLIIFGLTILLLVLYCYASLTCLANYVLIVLFLVLLTRNTSWLSGFCFRSSSSWSSSGTCSKVQIIPLLVSLWNQQSGPDHHFSGQPLEPTVGTRSSLLWLTSNTCSRVQIILLLVSLWTQRSGPDQPFPSEPLEQLVGTSSTCSRDQIIPLLVSLWTQQADQNIPLLVSLWSQQLGPDHPSSGQPMVPTGRTRSSFFWLASGSNRRDQIIPLLVSLWFQQGGSNHPSSGGPLEQLVGTRSLLWCTPDNHSRDMIISLPVKIGIFP